MTIVEIILCPEYDIEMNLFVCLFVCLFDCNGISTFVGYSMPNPFHTNKQSNFKQFSLA